MKSLNGLLDRQSRACNFVWNYCNDRQKDALRFGRPWLSGFDLNRLTTGSSKELGLHSGTVNAVCEQYARSRSQKKRPYLRYRGRRSLGWVPIKGRELKREGDAFRSARQPLRGVGIDLGLKDFATLSTGEKIEAQRIYRGAEQALALAQRANKKRRIRAIHAKIANRRNDFLHKLSDRIVRQFDYIAVGNVAAARLARTGMAKSVLDAGWSTFRKQLAYKAVKHGAWFEEVDERLTSQVCSNCGAMPDSRPKGIADLGIREWQCRVCGCKHDRDINAAINILRRGRATLAAGIPVL